MIHRLLPHWARFWSRFPRVVEVDGRPIHVAPGVLDPVATKAGAWFAQQVVDLGVDGTHLLDMGCGTGVVGVLAEQAGAKVTACDLDPNAIQCARQNGLEDVREGDLFNPVNGMRFQIICFNPPFIAQPARGRRLDLAMMGGTQLETLRRFSAAVDDHLAPDGRAWVVLSDHHPVAWDVLGQGWARIIDATIDGETFAIWQRTAAR